MTETPPSLFDSVNLAPSEVQDAWRDYLTGAVEGLWRRPFTSARNRSLLTVAALTTLSSLNELRPQIRFARTNGLSRLELREVMMQVAGYGGLARARDGMQALKEAFAEEQGDDPAIPSTSEERPNWPDDRRGRAHALQVVRHGKERADSIFASFGPYDPGEPFDPDQQQWLAWIMETAFADLWARPNLALDERSRVTIAVLMVSGRTFALKSHIRGGLNLGISRTDMAESIMHLAPYLGFEVAVEGMQTLREVLDEQ